MVSSLQDKATLSVIGFPFRGKKTTSADQLHSFLTHCLSNLLPHALLCPESFQEKKATRGHLMGHMHLCLSVLTESVPPALGVCFLSGSLSRTYRVELHVILAWWGCGAFRRCPIKAPSSDAPGQQRWVRRKSSRGCLFSVSVVVSQVCASGRACVCLQVR